VRYAASSIKIIVRAGLKEGSRMTRTASPCPLSGSQLGVIESGPTLGFPITRFIGHAEPILLDESTTNEWVEYEARLNNLLPGYDNPVICSCDANLLTGTVAVDILHTHPVAIIRGRFYENPCFVPLTEFLREIRARHKGQVSDTAATA